MTLITNGTLNDSPRAASASAVKELAPRLLAVGNWGNGLQHVGSDGIATVGMYVLIHTVHRDCRSVRLLYANMSTQPNGDGTNQLGNGWNPITIRVAVADALTGGNRWAVTFGGRRDVTIDPDGWVMSDELGIDLAVGATLYERVNVSVASAGMKWPTGLGTQYAETGTTANDKTLTGTVSAADAKAYSCVGIVGVPKKARQLAVGLMGDSWSASGADGAAPHPVINVARTGESVLAATTQGIRRRLPFMEFATHIEHAYGINDFQQATGTYDLPAHKVRYIARWAMLSSRGQVYQWTCTPKTTTTDAWATVANQTNGMPNASIETARVAWNNWLRDGAPLDAANLAAAAIGATGAAVIRCGAAGHPLAGVMEVADVVESARDSGLWKAGYTSDGVHPNTTGSNALLAFKASHWAARAAEYGVRLGA